MVYSVPFNIVKIDKLDGCDVLIESTFLHGISYIHDTYHNLTSSKNKKEEEDNFMLSELGLKYQLSVNGPDNWDWIHLNMNES